MNNQDAIKHVLSTVKPDAAMMMEAIKKANDTISMLSNELKNATARWNEIFITCATVLHKYGGEVRLVDDDMIALSPETYTITAEKEEVTGDRVIRLRHVSGGGSG